MIGPVQLHVATVKKVEANSLATTRYFFVTDISEEPNKIYEYRLNEEDAGKKQPDLVLGECTLVVMADDLQILAGKKTASSDELNAKSTNTLLKLIIGMAKGGYRYDQFASKSTIPKDISNDLMDCGLEVSDDTVRKWLKEAAALLPHPKTGAK